MSGRDGAQVEAVCPCCGARLKIDATFGRVVSHQAPPKRTQAPDLERASALLRNEAAQREAHFRHSAEAEKIKPQLLERKFEEALAKSKDAPLTPPTRDIDLE